MRGTGGVPDLQWCTLAGIPCCRSAACPPSVRSRRNCSPQGWLLVGCTLRNASSSDIISKLWAWKRPRELPQMAAAALLQRSQPQPPVLPLLLHHGLWVVAQAP